MLIAYCTLFTLAAVLMTLGCGLPAVLLAAAAGALALREELRTVWYVARTPVPVPAPKG